MPQHGAGILERPAKGHAILHFVECFCGCETTLPNGLIGVNLQASEVALELLAWDRARVADPGLVSEAIDIDVLVARGASCYQRLLLTLHEGRDDDSPPAGCEEWLRESRHHRRDRDDMTEKGFFRSTGALRVTEWDLKQLDRANPELSFSGTRPHGGTPEDEDVAGQLERLGALHARGILSDQEFCAAKGLVLGQARDPTAP